MKKYPPLYLIEWRDHSGGTGWRMIDSVDLNPCIVSSVGFLLKETKYVYLISSAICVGDGDLVQYHKILKSDVVRKKRLHI